MKDEYQKVINSIMNRERRIDLLIPSKVDATKFKRMLKRYDFDSCDEQADNLINTSTAIKLGHLIEVITKIVLEKHDAKILYTFYRIKRKDGSEEKKELDVLFEYENKRYLIEIKINDDHDSTKKTTIIPSLRQKAEDNHADIAILWFANNILRKNQAYYKRNIQENEYLCYYKEIVPILISIMGEKIKNFSDEFDELYYIYKQQYREAGKKFNKNIDLNKIDLNRLADLFKNYPKEEVLNTFFSGENISKEILMLLSKKTCKSKQYLKEVL